MDKVKELNTKFGKFLLRPYRDEDKEKVIDLWETAFRKEINKKIWDWKYHDNPFGREMMLCFDASNQPIVLYAAIPYPAQWDKQEIIMGQLVDHMSHPAYRHAVSGRKGLFIQTADFFYNVFENLPLDSIHYGFPGIKNFKLSKIFLKGRSITQNKFYFELSINNCKKDTFSMTKKIKEIYVFDEKFDNLWKSNKKDYPFSVIRNSKFLNWRFSQHPINKYHSYGLFNHKNKLLGYVIFLLDGDVATIVDIFSANDRKVLHHLIVKIIDRLRKHEIKKVRIWIPENHFIAQAVLDSGFQPIDEPLGIIPEYRHSSANINLNNMNKLFFTMADGDLF